MTTILLIQTGLGDVLEDGVSLAGVGDTGRGALVLWECTEFTPHLGRIGVSSPPLVASRGTAGNSGPRCHTAVVQVLPVLVEALTAGSTVGFSVKGYLSACDKSALT